MPSRILISALVCLLALAALSGCGGDDSDSSTSPDTAASKPAPPKSASPAADGRSLEEIVNSADGHAELVVSPAALAFYRGENRYPFGVFNPDRSQVDDAEGGLHVGDLAESGR